MIPSRTRIALLVLVGALAALAAPARADMTISDYSAGTHDRFEGGPLFIGQTYDWSGVGRAPAFATMISPTYFLTSHHARPLDLTLVTFQTGNSLTSGTETYQVQSVTQIGNTDLAVGRLMGPVSAQIAQYPILLLDSFAAYQNRDVFMVGQDGLDGQRIGTNNIEPVGGPTDPAFPFDDLAGTVGMTYVTDYDPLTSNEALVQGGDSGAPTFGVVNGQLAIVGIHWLLVSDTGGTFYSMDTFVPFYLNEISAILALGGESVTVVPEPSTWAMLAMSLAGAVAWRRRYSTRPRCA